MQKSFARIYDYAMAPLEKRYINSWRKKLLIYAKGKVLEIGAGTGVNFSLYNKCEEVIAIEPNPYMIEKAKSRINLNGVPIKVMDSSAEKIPLPDDHFDTIVSMLVLCSVDNMDIALKELRRVLKPGGNLLVLEHVKMEKTIYARLQQILTPVWKRIADGCHLDRETESMIRKSGFRIVSKNTYLSSLVVSIVATIDTK
ncbi:class I SAM-dependent methyltransferase [Aquibacillus rhizosphaerae]|uniref:Class I SAM-dependent methyltransferase n=1 Tax=Aquibacillus rhizosphaerae TaxID=3051431 RepID=A0ABT7LAR4_9BACI|nr:class I SAM-dependent methyltransferase [Aquibacillus sp. LR5S19]MDL4842954.1 class I SAM-dependent methyltransferase [Aquibacillus sp. LR5S19]